jgi:MoaA/NifB/PqqE/SkfB family radical SAM enzyme
MNFKLESFCPEPWSQIEISMAGDYSICCLANYDKDFGMARDDNDQVMNVMTHSFREALNSKTHKDHRLQLARNEKPTRCRNCYDAEDSTRGLTEWGISKSVGRSKRQRVISITAKTISNYVKVDNADQYTSEDGTSIAPLVNLHLRFGNLCNMKCVMCSPQHSNLWYEDWLAMDYYDGEPIFKLGRYKTYYILPDENRHGKLSLSNMEPWWETDIWWQRFDEIIPQLRYIYFTGGEPFLVPALEICLDKMIAAGVANRITLRFDTNLSVIHTRILEKLKKFHDIIMCVSIDETEERYELIRNPGKYDRFVNNVKILKEYKIPIDYISSCIGIATIYAMMRVSAVAKELGVASEFRFLEGPKWLDLRYLPRSAKEEIISNYQKHPSTDPRDLKWFKAMVNLLNKYIDAQPDYEKLNEFVRCMDILDKQRGTNWRVTLDDVYSLLKRHCDPDKIINL